jgi:DNA polymerase IV (DinB-like DNA polymerase)
MSGRIVLHLDMDAFFAAIEELLHPELAGEPIVVGADPKGGRGRGVVSTANYPARRYGIHSAQPISEAYRLCPHAHFLPVRHGFYGKVSERIMRLVRDAGNYPFEQVSIDEAYVEVSKLASLSKAEKLARELKEKIFEQEKLTCTIGIGPNRLIAKIASGRQKPDGLTIVAPSDTQKFLDPLPVRELIGVGPKTEERLNALGIKTIADLRKFPKTALADGFGKFGATLFEQARGRDDRPVEEKHEVKSIGQQTTFAEDTNNRGLLLKTLATLASDVHGQLQAGTFLYRTVTVIIRFANFETHTSSHTLRKHTESIATLKAQSLKLALPFLQSRRKMRLVGVRVSHLLPKTIKR